MRTPFTLTGSRHRRRRRRADLPVGAERHRRARRHHAGRQHQDQRAAVPGLRHDADVTDEDSPEDPSPGENLADGSPTRVFPDMAQVLAGNTNAADRRLPGGADAADPAAPDAAALRRLLLGVPARPRLRRQPGLDRPAMHFRLTARDGRPGRRRRRLRRRRR